jgi:hypothetical protein
MVIETSQRNGSYQRAASTGNSTKGGKKETPSKKDNNNVCLLEDVMRKKTVPRKLMDHGDIVGHRNFKEDPVTTPGSRGKSVVGNKKNQVSETPVFKPSLKRADKSKYTSSFDNNELVDSPSNNFIPGKKRSGTAITKSNAFLSSEDNEDIEKTTSSQAISGSRKGRPSTVPQPQSDILSFEPEKFKSYVNEEFVNFLGIGNRKKESPARLKTLQSEVFNFDNNEKVAYPLLPSVNYTFTSGQSIAVPLRQRPIQNLKSEGVASIMSWPTEVTQK